MYCFFTENKKGIQKKLQRRKAVKVVSEACPHSLKADARERKKNRSVKLHKLYIWTKKKKKKTAIERTTQLVPKKQFGCPQ